MDRKNGENVTVGDQFISQTDQIIRVYKIDNFFSEIKTKKKMKD